MAKFTLKKIDLDKINGGERFNETDYVENRAINDPIEASAYAQALATNPVDNTTADQTGVASVSIQEMSNGTPQLKFSNLKGAKGDKGDKGDKGEQGLKGEGNGLFGMEVEEGNLILYHQEMGNTKFVIGDDGYMRVEIGG